jgi:transcription elongation factor Elf1
MPTPPREIAEMQRPRRRLGTVLRQIVNCPLCPGSPGDSGFAEAVRIVRWRERTARVECVTCGLRFSIDIPALVETLRARPGDVLGFHFPKSNPRRFSGKTFAYLYAEVAKAGGTPTDPKALSAAARELADRIEHVHSLGPSPAVTTPPSRAKSA